MPPRSLNALMSAGDFSRTDRRRGASGARMRCLRESGAAACLAAPQRAGLDGGASGGRPPKWAPGAGPSRAGACFQVEHGEAAQTAARRRRRRRGARAQARPQRTRAAARGAPTDRRQPALAANRKRFYTFSSSVSQFAPARGAPLGGGEATSVCQRGPAGPRIGPAGRRAGPRRRRAGRHGPFWGVVRALAWPPPGAGAPAERLARPALERVG